MWTELNLSIIRPGKCESRSFLSLTQFEIRSFEIKKIITLLHLFLVGTHFSFLSQVVGKTYQFGGLFRFVNNWMVLQWILRSALFLFEPIFSKKEKHSTVWSCHLQVLPFRDIEIVIVGFCDNSVCVIVGWMLLFTRYFMHPVIFRRTMAQCRWNRQLLLLMCGQRGNMLGSLRWLRSSLWEDIPGLCLGSCVNAVISPFPSFWQVCFQRPPYLDRSSWRLHTSELSWWAVLWGSRKHHSWRTRGWIARRLHPFVSVQLFMGHKETNWSKLQTSHMFHYLS